MKMIELEKKDYGDLPLKECAIKGLAWMANDFLVFQKFTCEKCGNRLTIEEPNKFFTSGSCDKCNHVTQIKKCGFMTIGKIKTKG